MYNIRTDYACPYDSHSINIHADYACTTFTLTMHALMTATASTFTLTIHAPMTATASTFTLCIYNAGGDEGYTPETSVISYGYQTLFKPGSLFSWGRASLSVTTATKVVVIVVYISY
jgi:hypothetical protein